MMKLWHNPRCSKSRETKKLLEDKGVDFQVRLYLDDPPSRDELLAVLGALGMEARDLMRTGDAEAKALGVRDWPREDAPWLQTLVEHPKLIQRPILVTDDGRAALGRPPENVLTIL